jgi:hypothetical protein
MLMQNRSVYLAFFGKSMNLTNVSSTHSRQSNTTAQQSGYPSQNSNLVRMPIGNFVIEGMVEEVEQERSEREKHKQEKREQERREQERREQERREQERREQERREQEKLARLEEERLARLEQERLSKLEQERLARLEQEKLARLEHERVAGLEQERLGIADGHMGCCMLVATACELTLLLLHESALALPLLDDPLAIL